MSDIQHENNNELSTLVSAINPILKRVLLQVQRAAQHDEILRNELMQIGQSLMAFAQPSLGLTPASAPAETTSSPAETPQNQPVAQNTDTALYDDGDDDGDSHLQRTWMPPTEVNAQDLVWLKARCRMKADAAKWAAERKRRLENWVDMQVEIIPFDREMLRRASKLPDCFVWTHRLSLDGVGKADDYAVLAGNFECAAEAIDFAELMLSQDNTDDVQNANNNSLTRALYLLAEAQSGLRAAVQRFSPDWRYDQDQMLIFQWLRQVGRENNIFIAQYMRLDDTADPQYWQERTERIRRTQAEVSVLTQQVNEEQQRLFEEEQAKVQQAEQRTKKLQDLMSKVKYHTKNIQKNGVTLLDWQRVFAAADELVTLGVPPSNLDFRTALVPVLDQMPETIESTKNTDLILREIDSYLASQEGNAAEEVRDKQIALSDDVRKAAVLLRGRSLVMIGGDRRPHMADALQTALGLHELIWIETRSHQSYTMFEPDVARNNVALVLLAIRWASHNFGEVKNICDHYNKPLVRLPSGYSPNQVAAQILKQAAARLA